MRNPSVDPPTMIEVVRTKPYPGNIRSVLQDQLNIIGNDVAMITKHCDEYELVETVGPSSCFYEPRTDYPSTEEITKIGLIMNGEYTPPHAVSDQSSGAQNKMKHARNASACSRFKTTMTERFGGRVLGTH